MLVYAKIAVLLSVCLTSICAEAADDPALRTNWDSEYATEQNVAVQAIVRLKKDPTQTYGGGTYEAFYNNQPVGNGAFSDVRVEIKNRVASPLPVPGTPLPGPTSPLGGVSNLSQTKFIKGLWTFGSETGWFKWELYESGGVCRFTGTWGNLVNGTQGPTKGTWKGTLRPNVGGPVSPVAPPGSGVIQID